MTHEASSANPFTDDEPLPTPPTICPDCHCEVSETVHGFVLERTTRELMACPTCSPPVIATRVARQTAERTKAQGIWQIPAYARDWTWQTLADQPRFSDHASLAFCRRFVEGLADIRTFDSDSLRSGEKRGLYLFGPMGIGKTGMATCVLRDLMAAGHSGAFIRTTKFFRELKTSLDPNTPGKYSDQVKLAESVEVLVLDDLAVERPSGFVLEFLMDFLEERRETGLVTVVTSNLDYDTLRETWLSAARSDLDAFNVARIVERLGRYCRLRLVEGENLSLEDESEGDE